MIQAELRARGEERFVLLKNEVEDERDVGEDTD